MYGAALVFGMDFPLPIRGADPTSLTPPIIEGRLAENTGDPNMEGVTSRWPDTTRITVTNGMRAVSYTTTRDGMSSVGTLTLDARGGMRVTESTLTPKPTQPAVIFDVLEATCHPGTE